jgi:hypothetical protein
MKYYDPIMNQTIEELWDHSTQILTTRISEDVEPLLEELAEARGNGNRGWSKKRTWRKVGSIPCLEVERILREENINVMEDSPEAKKRLRRYFQDNYKLSTVG